MEEIVEAAQWNHADGGKQVYYMSVSAPLMCLNTKLLSVFPFPYMCVFNFFSCENFHSLFRLFQPSAEASQCLLDQSAAGEERSAEEGV